MTVHVLIPVFNRLEMTRSIIDQLRSQVLDEALAITVVDDGSTDGSDEFLREQPDVSTLKGDGNLWWGGAIDLGLRYVLPMAAEKDWVLFVNNDTEIRPDFVQRLLDSARRHAPAAVGCVVRDIAPPHQVLSVGPRIDPRRFVVEEVGKVPSPDDGVVEIDALSGRGVIYPAAALQAAGGMRRRWLPHYLGDYEVSLRVRAQGWRLLVACDTTVYSAKVFGSAYRPRGLRERYFSVRSPTYLPAQLAFWWGTSGFLGRITLPFRLIVHFVTRAKRARNL